MKALIATALVSLLAVGSASADQADDYIIHSVTDLDQTHQVAVNVTSLPATAAGRSDSVSGIYNLNGPFEMQD
jgi:hypothetical protein